MNTKEMTNMFEATRTTIIGTRIRRKSVESIEYEIHLKNLWFIEVLKGSNQPKLSKKYYRFVITSMLLTSQKPGTLNTERVSVNFLHLFPVLTRFLIKLYMSYRLDFLQDVKN